MDCCRDLGHLGYANMSIISADGNGDANHRLAATNTRLWRFPGKRVDRDAYSLYRGSGSCRFRSDRPVLAHRRQPHTTSPITSALRNWNSRRAAGRSGRGKVPPLWAGNQSARSPPTTTNSPARSVTQSRDWIPPHFQNLQFKGHRALGCHPIRMTVATIFTHPQSFNRYSYVENFPLSDPGPAGIEKVWQS